MAWRCSRGLEVRRAAISTEPSPAKAIRPSIRRTGRGGIEGRVGTGSLRIPFVLELTLGSRDAEREGDRIEFTERSVAFGAAWEFRIEERFAVVPGVLLSTLELEADPGDGQHQLFGNSGTRSRKQLGALDLAAAFETEHRVAVRDHCALTVARARPAR